MEKILIVINEDGTRSVHTSTKVRVAVVDKRRIRERCAAEPGRESRIKTAATRFYKFDDTSYESEVMAKRDEVVAGI